MHPLSGLAISYLAGSVPFAYLAGRSRGIDLRQHGSGNLGATNASRVLGRRLGALVYVADTLKGMLPALLLPGFIDAHRPDLWAIGFGVAAIAGHVRPVFLMGQGGGKGVATAGGVFFGLAWQPAVIALVAFVAVVAVTRFVSAGSLTAAVVLPVAIFFFRGAGALFLISCAIGALVIWMHRGNIARLTSGSEPKLFAGKPEAAGE